MVLLNRQTLRLESILYEISYSYDYFIIDILNLNFSSIFYSICENTLNTVDLNIAKSYMKLNTLKLYAASKLRSCY